jgi:hypothetical protein
MLKSFFTELNEAAFNSQARNAANPELSKFSKRCFDFERQIDLNTLSIGSTVDVSKNITDAIRNTKVVRVHFHGSKTGTDQRPALHWRLFFELDTGNFRSSVEFNSQQVALDKYTKLFVTYRPYLTSNRSDVGGSYPVSFYPGVTVAQVLSLVLAQKRDRYRLTDEGSGCRNWCLTVISDLEASGFVPRGSVQNVENYLIDLHHTMQDGRYWIPYPLRQGTFY